MIGISTDINYEIQSKSIILDLNNFIL